MRSEMGAAAVLDLSRVTMFDLCGLGVPVPATRWIPMGRIHPDYWPEPGAGAVAGSHGIDRVVPTVTDDATSAGRRTTLST